MFYALRWQRFKGFSNNDWSHLLLLLIWIGIGAGLRFFHLEFKSLRTDEFATLVFSLGNSFRTVPLNQAITLDMLLQPLQPNSHAGTGMVMQHLLSESNHPPLYFGLAHWWMRLFPTDRGLVSIWAARALPALLGTASIPAVFGLGWLAFRSRLVGQLAAAMMAVSPYGIHLAQEARHYTLAILWIIASLCCLVIATRAINRRTSLPIWLGLTWIGVNSLGIATHYFVGLTLCSEALVLARQWLQHWREKGAWLQSYWWQIYAIAAGTFLGALVWLPTWQVTSYNDGLTEWIHQGNRAGLEQWLDPVLQGLVTWITMLSLLPVEGTARPVMIASGLILLIFVIWSLPILYRGLIVKMQQPNTRSATLVLGGFVLAAIALFFSFTYGLGINLLATPRYHFVYFPGVVVLLGASLATRWNLVSIAGRGRGSARYQRSVVHLKANGRKAVGLIILMGLVGGLTVIWNFAYTKTQRPELLVPIVQRTSQAPVLIATAHQSHSETGRMMGLAWEFKHSGSSDSSMSRKMAFPRFLLAHQNQDPRTSVTALQQVVANLPRPLDLWLVNFQVPVELGAQNCVAASDFGQGRVDGYDYRLYHCSRPG